MTKDKSKQKDVLAASFVAIGSLMILTGAVGFFEEIIFSLPWWLAMLVGGFIAILIGGVIGE